jgi:hypothetical protein
MSFTRKPTASDSILYSFGIMGVIFGSILALVSFVESAPCGLVNDIGNETASIYCDEGKKLSMGTLGFAVMAIGGFMCYATHRSSKRPDSRSQVRDKRERKGRT